MGIKYYFSKMHTIGFYQKKWRCSCFVVKLKCDEDF